MVRAKRIYEPVERDDGYRVLVDHIWPRGVSRERACLDEWARRLAPSAPLRKRFGHNPDRFAEFCVDYRHELSEQRGELDQLRRRAREGCVTVLYAARDELHNNGVVVAALLSES